ncbi:phage replisome organizer N-terminal domain-containing protein [Pseudobacillus badius]|uniref:phage replisome organizer N-terminal domain-containing protein n=1 Tax=Bacillus badius TaxID=1455 RepID=UPI0024A40310|nr:phage replisome organizer N-terminal domain-containing protein [Bacillus badius]GLY11369.1 hypothetical protein Bbad01_25850 [Bacillus badius]
MSEVKWIKLSTQMFEDEKIRLIESLPEADTILIIWIKLLSQAGKTNANGYIYLSENIPYTDEMLATIFNRPITVVRMALKTFQDFGMIEISDNHFISISNWEKHQNVAGLDKIREQTRQRVARHREKLRLESGNATSNVTVTKGNATEEELEEDKDLDKDKEKKDIKGIVASAPSSLFSEVVDYLNQKARTKYRASSKKTQNLIKARFNEGFTLDDFKTVIDKKTAEWLTDQKMNQYLRPETLFGTKFESYLNQKGGQAHAKTKKHTDLSQYNFDKEPDFDF